VTEAQPRSVIVEPEIRQYVLILWSRWWLIALTTLLAAGGAFVYSRSQTPIYRSTATLEVQQGSDPGADAYRASLNNQTVASTYVIQVTARPVMVEVVARLGLQLDPRAAGAMISASQVRDSGMIQVSAQSPNPGLAQALAATTAQVFIEQKSAQEQERYMGSLRELEAQVKALEMRIQDTRGAIAGLGDRSDLSSAGRTELARLETQSTTDQTRLTILLQSTEQFKLAMVRSGNYLTIFSPAELPGSPISPQPLRNTALAAVVGAMLGVGAIFLLEYLDDTVHTPQEIERLLGVNSLGGIPELVNEKEGRSLVVTHQPLHPVSEAFRNLRTSVQFADLDRDITTLMVTSPLPAEGKSFVAANLAAAIAQSGRKVVLVEADLRHPTVHRVVKLSREPGLSDALLLMRDSRDEAWRRGELQALLRPVPDVEGLLLVLTSGASVSNPAELLGSRTFKQLLAWLREYADVVVIDTPPVVSVTDAAVVATLVDAVVIVAEASQTRLGVLNQACRRLEDVGARVLGVVVNRLNARTGGYYYYYYYHHYPYGAGRNGNGNGPDAGDVQGRRGTVAHRIGLDAILDMARGDRGRRARKGAPHDRA
jgi:capsular exopolysaccharide synthesis family protein